MSPAHFILFVLSCIAFSKGKWATGSSPTDRNVLVNHSYVYLSQKWNKIESSHRQDFTRLFVTLLLGKQHVLFDTYFILYIMANYSYW